MFSIKVSQTKVVSITVQACAQTAHVSLYMTSRAMILSAERLFQERDVALLRLHGR